MATNRPLAKAKVKRGPVASTRNAAANAKGPRRTGKRMVRKEHDPSRKHGPSNHDVDDEHDHSHIRSSGRPSAPHAPHARGRKKHVDVHAEVNPDAHENIRKLLPSGYNPSGLAVDTYSGDRKLNKGDYERNIQAHRQERSRQADIQYYEDGKPVRKPPTAADYERNYGGERNDYDLHGQTNQTRNNRTHQRPPSAPASPVQSPPHREEQNTGHYDEQGRHGHTDRVRHQLRSRHEGGADYEDHNSQNQSHGDNREYRGYPADHRDSSRPDQSHQNRNHREGPRVVEQPEFVRNKAEYNEDFIAPRRREVWPPTSEYRKTFQNEESVEQNVTESNGNHPQSRSEPIRPKESNWWGGIANYDPSKDKEYREQKEREARAQEKLVQQVHDTRSRSGASQNSKNNVQQSSWWGHMATYSAPAPNNNKNSSQKTVEIRPPTPKDIVRAERKMKEARERSIVEEAMPIVRRQPIRPRDSGWWENITVSKPNPLDTHGVPRDDRDRPTASHGTSTLKTTAEVRTQQHRPGGPMKSALMRSEYDKQFDPCTDRPPSTTRPPSAKHSNGLKNQESGSWWQNPSPPTPIAGVPARNQPKQDNFHEHYVHSRPDNSFPNADDESWVIVDDVVAHENGEPVHRREAHPPARNTTGTGSRRGSKKPVAASHNIITGGVGHAWPPTSEYRKNFEEVQYAEKRRAPRPQVTVPASISNRPLSAPLPNKEPEKWKQMPQKQQHSIAAGPSEPYRKPPPLPLGNVSYADAHPRPPQEAWGNEDPHRRLHKNRAPQGKNSSAQTDDLMNADQKFIQCMFSMHIVYNSIPCLFVVCVCSDAIISFIYLFHVFLSSFL